RLAEIGAATVVIADDRNAVGTGRDVDAAGLERGDERLLRDLHFADDEGRDVERTAFDDDARAVRLDEDDIGAVDLDLRERGALRQGDGVVGAGLQDQGLSRRRGGGRGAHIDGR